MKLQLYIAMIIMTGLVASNALGMGHAVQTARSINARIDSIKQYGPAQLAVAAPVDAQAAAAIAHQNEVTPTVTLWSRLAARVSGAYNSCKTGVQAAYSACKTKTQSAYTTCKDKTQSVYSSIKNFVFPADIDFIDPTYSWHRKCLGFVYNNYRAMTLGLTTAAGLWYVLNKKSK